MQVELIDRLFNVIYEIVDGGNEPWGIKKNQIILRAEKSGHKVFLDEFLSWFDDDDDNVA